MRLIIVVLFGMLVFACGDPSKEAASEAAQEANSNITNTSDLEAVDAGEDTVQLSMDTTGTSRLDMQDTLEEGEEEERSYMVEP